MDILMDDLVTSLNQKFNGFKFTYKEVQFGGNIPVLFADVSCDEETFSSRWSNIVSDIALNFQSKLDDEFRIWNIYLFFNIKKPISHQLKVNIENNTFSCRKIIVCKKMSKKQIIDRYIKCSGIDLNNKAEIKAVFEPDPDILTMIHPIKDEYWNEKRIAKSYKLIAETYNLRMK